MFPMSRAHARYPGRTRAASKAAANVVGSFNDMPQALSLQVAGTPNVGQQLTGSYTYSDKENDAEGTTTFRWLRNGTAIGSATATTYTLVAADSGTSIVYEVTPVAATGTLLGQRTTSAAVAVNAVPVASNVNITADDLGAVGSDHTGHYTYTDAESDAEGVSTFRWLLDGSAIVGETTDTYNPIAGDVGKTLTFEVTPVASAGSTPGVAATSAGVVIVGAFVPTDVAGSIGWYDFSDVAALWKDTARSSAVT